MRQKDFAVGKVIQRRNRRKRLFSHAVIDDADDEVLFRLSRRHRQVSEDLRRLLRRSQTISTASFNINAYSYGECLTRFRFRAYEIHKICSLTGWTAGKTKRSRYKVDPFTATCIMLQRLAPTRWSDVEVMFGMRASALSEVFWELIISFSSSNSHLLSSFQTELMTARAPAYAAAIHAKGAPLLHCVGFIDCTKIQMTRPGGSAVLQRSVYSGHKSFHCFIYQTVTTPDGLLFYMYGPEVGRRHDMTLYRESGLDGILQSTFNNGGVQYCLYGDAAYILRPWLQTAFPRLGASAEQLWYNKGMSSVREAVEWTHKDIKQLWTTQDFKRKLNVRQSPIALLYQTAAILWNFRVCMSGGGQVSSYFNCDPPSLSDYLNRNALFGFTATS